MDIEDLQATVTAGSCSSRVIFNVPEARNRGAELELTAAPSPHFDFAIAASYNDSELQSTLTSGGQVVAGIRAGNRLPSVPEFQASAAATYQRTVFADWLGFVTATYQHVGSRFTQIGDQAAGFGVVNLRALPNTIGGPLTINTFTFDPELPAYDVVNLRFGALRDRWELAFFVNNVTDERALLALDQERGTLARVGYLTNQPRTFGLTTRVNF
jgi:iron complex outermembrane receptor protein